MLQIVDISDQIMYDQTQAQNDVLSLINVCISHELRNPLNSITAENIRKKSLLMKLQKSANVTSPQVKNYMKEMIESIEVQDSQSYLMQFLVQGILDYS